MPFNGSDEDLFHQQRIPMNLAFPEVESTIPPLISFDSEASVERLQGTGRVSVVSIGEKRLSGAEGEVFERGS
jgi:hypothetical protein